MILRLVNPLSLVFLIATRIVLRLFWLSYSLTWGILKVVWIPVKGFLYVFGGIVALGAIAGIILVITHGGHLHNSPDNAPPARVFGK